MSGNVKLALSHVVPDLVLKVLKGQDPLHILGEGNQVRHYTYGADLAHGIRLAMESPKAVNEDFNLSTARLNNRPRAGRADLAQGLRFRQALPVRLRPAVRARRPAARTGRAQGTRSPWFRGDDLDAMLDEVIPGSATSWRAGACDKRPERAHEGRSSDREVAAKVEIWREIVAYLSRWIDPNEAVLDIACDRGYFLRWVHARQLGLRHP